MIRCDSFIVCLASSPKRLTELARCPPKLLTTSRFVFLFLKAFVELTRDIFELVRGGDIKIQDGWEGVKSGFVPNTVHSSEEVTKGSRQCYC